MITPFPFLKSIFSFVLLFVSTLTWAFVPGSYQAKSVGHGGELTIEATYSSTELLKIEVLNHHETSYLGEQALEDLSQRIVSAQSLNVDAISGATQSSYALIESVYKTTRYASGKLQASPQTLKKIQTYPSKVDVIVVGSGAAGLSAAIAAKSSGANVIVLEKLGVNGGSTSLSSAPLLLNQALTKLEKHAYQSRFKNYPDPARMLDFLPRVQSTMHWLNHEVKFENDLLAEYKIGHPPTLGDGRFLISSLLKKAHELQIPIKNRTEVVELLKGKDNRVIGVRIKTPSGGRLIHAKSTILATGGFARNPLLISLQMPYFQDTPEKTLSSIGSTGDGIFLSEAFQAGLEKHASIVPYSLMTSTKSINDLVWTKPVNHQLIINAYGDLITKSNVTATLYEAACSKRIWLITDSLDFELAEQLHRSLAWGEVLFHQTLEGLGTRINIHPNSLKKSIRAFNQAYPKDSLETPPYFAIRLRPQSVATIGGLTIDEKQAVLDIEGNQIAGLYAAGEVANGFYYGDFYYPGMGVLLACATGYEAGLNASKK